jgi:predicted Rossmann fold nucleotide-binding protein DprA/Smf involved in DNA uptake
MQITRIPLGSPDYPSALLRSSGSESGTPPVIHVIGEAALLRQPLTALFCSTKCPGQVILDAFDRIAQLRDAGRAVISGFHTPVEKECLRILLRGASPIVLCPARSLDRLRVPPDWKPALDAGRILLVSPFASGTTRMTAELAQRRNEFVTALATEILILHATLGGRLETLVRQLEQSGRRVRRFDKASTEESATSLAVSFSSVPGSSRAPL